MWWCDSNGAWDYWTWVKKANKIIETSNRKNRKSLWNDHLLCFPFYRFTEMELYSCTQYIFESCAPKNLNIEKAKKKKKRKNWDEKRENDRALAILAMEGDRGTRAISCERVAGFDIVGWNERYTCAPPHGNTRMHRVRENQNQETGECLSDHKSIHILLVRF